MNDPTSNSTNGPTSTQDDIGKDVRADQWLLSGQVHEHEPVKQFRICGEKFTVGRQSGSTLCLPLGSVSKNHAEIVAVDGGLILRDLGSTNGTFVNGYRIEGQTILNDGDLVQFASSVFRVCKRSRQTEIRTVTQDNVDQALAMMQFDRLINDGGFVPYFQPIVRLSDKQRIGFEVLGRSRLFGLQSPVEMFTAASQLNLEPQLSEAFRRRGVEIGSGFGDETSLFLNTHPKELGLDQFYQSLYELREISNQRFTLEIHERAATNSQIMQRLRRVLQELDIQLAFDDFGVGEARLVELGEYRPDFLKFDMGLTRSINQAPAKQQEVVALLARLVNELGIQSLAEGVENQESHDVLVEMGFSLGQGYFYGKPDSISKFL
jgi:EAL domain-containing protein (putative c-di-GMP-specific phosphodiesterase class I)